MMSWKAARIKLESIKKSIANIVDGDVIPIEDSDVTGQILREKLDRYEKALNDFSVSAVSEADIASVENSMEEYVTFSEKAEDFLLRLLAKNRRTKEIALVEKQGSECGSTSGCHSAINAKLPTLELEKFDGDRLKYNSFWSSFERRIDNKPIPAGDKFEYLRQSLTKEAGSCIAGMIISDENYVKAKEILKKKYGDTAQQVDAHRAAILMLPTCKDVTSEISKTYYLIEEHLNNLQSLGKPSLYDDFLPLIKSKFPASICIRIEEMLDDDQELTLSLFRTKLLRILTVREKNERAENREGGQVSPSTPNWRKSGFSGSPRNPNFSRSPGYKGSSTVLTTGVRSPTVQPSTPCIYCNEIHWNDDCPNVPTVEERRRKLFGRCFVCLSPRHLSNQCESEKPCYHCGQTRKHHRSLCAEYVKHLATNVKITSTEISEPPVEDVPATLVAVVNANQDTYVPAAVAFVSGRGNGGSVAVKVILDTASQSSFITEQLATRLNIVKTGFIQLELKGFGDLVPRSTVCSTGEIRIHVQGGFILVNVIIVPHIANQFITNWYYKEIARLKLLYPSLRINAPPRQGVFDVLLGVDYYYQIVQGRTVNLNNGMFLSETRLGYLLVGKRLANKLEVCLVSQANVIENRQCVCWPVNVDLRKYWELELLGLHSGLDSDDYEAIESFNKSIEFKNNRYYVSWPWKIRPPPLPNNYFLAFNRLKSVYRQLSLNNELDQYDAIFKDQENTDIIEKVKERNGALEHYIPHLGVRRGDHRTTKLRVVFDASAKIKKSHKSLNDCLLKGRTLIEDLFYILMRFRMHPYVLLGDIEKAFLQIELKELEDRDVVRFLWLKDFSLGVIDSNIQIYRFRRVAFGVVSSPFLLNAVIKHHIGRNLGQFPNLRCITQAIYVDNLVVSVPSEELARQVYFDAKKLFSDASMNLREWVTNSDSVSRILAEEDRPKQQEEVEGVLGILWDSRKDCLCLKPPQYGLGECVSKRTVLQFLACIFDPFGFLSPTVLLGKLFLRNLWCLELSWDKVLDTSLYKEWKVIFGLLVEGVTLVQVPRCLKIHDSQSCELHVFTDASFQAYHANVYLRIVRSNLVVDTFLLLAKNRVAPADKSKCKSLTIPRLELLAISIGCKCLISTRKVFGDITAYVWSDSQCALKWIKTEKVLPTFEENRVKNIREVPNVNFNFIPGELNPADVATRKISDNSYLKERSWWHGPDFLVKDKCYWPTWDYNINSEEFIEQEPGTSVLATLVEQGPSINPPYNIQLEQYSSLHELLLDSINSLTDDTADISSQQVLVQWIKFVQSCVFDKELHSDKFRKRGDLRLWIDDGVLRCSSRLQNAALSDEAIFPILLPSNHHITHLIIRDVHESAQHVGPHQTLAILRHKYFIPRGLAAVNRVLRTCKECVRMTSGPYRIPDMPPLPKERVTRSSPFTHVGLDGLGPFLIQGKNGLEKVWVLVVTCLATRALDLGILEGLSAVQFLYAFREFVARRTCPETVVCDNALAFHTVATTSRNMWWSILRDQGVQEYRFSPLRTIQWRFIPSYSPFMGGVYERMVALIKNCIHRTLIDVVLNPRQFRVFICETQGILNNRPICPLDVNGCYLTPNHFLNLPIVSRGPLFRPVERGYERETLNVMNLWKKGVKLMERFWQIWNDRYLIFLANRRVWKIKQGRIVSKTLPKVGETVLLGDRTPRHHWATGKIVLLEGSRDGQVRSVVVELASGKRSRRSVGSLYPFEADVSELRTVGNEEGGEIEADLEVDGVEAGERNVAESEQEGGDGCSDTGSPKILGIPAKIVARRKACYESFESESDCSLGPDSPRAPVSPALRSVANANSESNESQSEI